MAYPAYIYVYVHIRKRNTYHLNKKKLISRSLTLTLIEEQEINVIENLFNLSKVCYNIDLQPHKVTYLTAWNSVDGDCKMVSLRTQEMTFTVSDDWISNRNVTFSTPKSVSVFVTLIWTKYKNVQEMLYVNRSYICEEILFVRFK